jgi:hypothetical protein
LENSDAAKLKKDAAILKALIGGHSGYSGASGKFMAIRNNSHNH